MDLIKPDKIHLNTAVRPVVKEYALPLSQEELAAAAAFLGERAEVIASFDRHRHPNFELSDADFLATLARRPQTAEDLAEVLGLPTVAATKRLKLLIRQGRITLSKHEGKIFYHAS